MPYWCFVRSPGFSRKVGQLNLPPEDTVLKVKR